MRKEREIEKNCRYIFFLAPTLIRHETNKKFAHKKYKKRPFHRLLIMNHSHLLAKKQIYLKIPLHYAQKSFHPL